MSDIIHLEFNGQPIDGLKTPSGAGLNDEQVGALLEYSDPGKAIRNLASRNAGELDGLSTYLTVRQVEGGRQVARQVRVWGREGIIAISFLAETQKGAEVRRWARETLIERFDNDPMPPRHEIATPRLSAKVLREVKGILKEGTAIAKLLPGLDPHSSHFYLAKLVRDGTGFDVDQAFGLSGQLIAPVKLRHMKPTEIGAKLSPIKTPLQVNDLLELMGHQTSHRSPKGRLVRSGCPASQHLWVLVNEKKGDTGGMVQVVRWYESVIPMIQAYLDAEAVG